MSETAVETSAPAQNGQAAGYAPTLPAPASRKVNRTRKQDIKLVRSYNIWDAVKRVYVSSHLDRAAALSAKEAYFAARLAEEEAANPSQPAE
jgi:hypothetical protein